MPNSVFCESRRCHQRNATTELRRIHGRRLMLCTACCEKIRSSLEEVPELYDQCGAAILEAPDSRRNNIRRPRMARPAFNDAAVDVRSDIMSLLASCSAMVAEQRQLSKPSRRDVRLLTTFLGRHLEWLLTHEAAPDFADEVTDTVARARKASGPRTRAHLELGSCVEEDCRRPLFVASDPRDGCPLQIRCEAGHSWRPHDWLLLARRLKPQR